MKTIQAYVKELVQSKGLAFKYKNATHDMKNITFDFNVEPLLTPHGDIAFKAGYQEDPEQTNTFLMTAEDAIELSRLLVNAAYKAMDYKLIARQQESCEAQLSFLVLKNLIDSIRIQRTDTKLENYEEPYYEYIISAYKGKEKVLSYAVAYNLSYFTKESQIDYWRDCLTDKQRVKLYFDGWNPYDELKERQKDAQEKALETLKNKKDFDVIKL